MLESCFDLLLSIPTRSQFLYNWRLKLWKSWFFFLFCPLPRSLYLFVISCLAQCVSNKAFLNWVLSLFQNEFLCTAVYDKMNAMPVQEKLISILKNVHQDSLWNRRNSNSEMDYSWLRIFWSFSWTKCFVFISFSLVVVSRFQPSPIVMALLPRLAPSRPFVVYCQYKEVTWHTRKALKSS